MNTKPKTIADIRYYENPARTAFGNVRHGSLGTLYPIPFRSFGAIGDRFACKLRELEFKFPGFDHLYVILTPSLPDGTAEPSMLNADGRIRFVDVGCSPEMWRALTDESKHDHLVDLTVAAMLPYSEDHDTLDAVARELKKWRSQLEIAVKTKETSSYRVDVTFQIRPLQEQSIAFVSYFDKSSGQRGRTVLAKLFSADDVFSLCGSIVVKQRTITITPRSSFRATLLTKKYKVPMSLTVDAVIAASGTEASHGSEPAVVSVSNGESSLPAGDACH